VRLIYKRYLELGCVRLLKDDLERRGIVSKIRLSRKGIKSGGRSFSLGALYELLSNPIYIGEIRHRQERHPQTSIRLLRLLRTGASGLQDCRLNRQLTPRFGAQFVSSVK